MARVPANRQLLVTCWRDPHKVPSRNFSGPLPLNSKMLEYQTHYKIFLFSSIGLVYFVVTYLLTRHFSLLWILRESYPTVLLVLSGHRVHERWGSQHSSLLIEGDTFIDFYCFSSAFTIQSYEVAIPLSNATLSFCGEQLAQTQLSISFRRCPL